MPHYKLVRGFDQIDIKDTWTKEGYITHNNDRFSVWLRIHRRKYSETIKDAKDLQEYIKQKQNEGFTIVYNTGLKAGANRQYYPY